MNYWYSCITSEISLKYLFMLDLQCMDLYVHAFFFFCWNLYVWNNICWSFWTFAPSLATWQDCYTFLLEWEPNNQRKFKKQQWRIIPFLEATIISSFYLMLRRSFHAFPFWSFVLFILFGWNIKKYLKLSQIDHQKIGIINWL